MACFIIFFSATFFELAQLEGLKDFENHNAIKTSKKAVFYQSAIRTIESINRTWNVEIKYPEEIKTKRISKGNLESLQTLCCPMTLRSCLKIYFGDSYDYVIRRGRIELIDAKEINQAIHSRLFSNWELPYEYPNWSKSMKRIVAPKGWRENGGQFYAIQLENDFLVYATQDVLEQIRYLLFELRIAKNSN